MIRWISGSFEATYVGEPSTLPVPDRGPGERRLRLRVLRAAVRNVCEAQAPGDAQPPVPKTEAEADDEGASQTLATASGADAAHTASAAPRQEEPEVAQPRSSTQPLGLGAGSERATFRQTRIDESHVAQILGAGTSYLGALYDVRVSDVALSYPSEKAGRAYGRMTGQVLACVVLPEPEAPELVEPAQLVKVAKPPAGPSELHVESADAEEADDAEEGTPGRARASLAADPEKAEAARTAEARARAKPSLLLLGFTVLVGIALVLSCGALPTLLWLVFMLPTLAARQLLVGVLPDTRPLHLFGVVLVAVQVVCVSVLMKGFWSADCKELALVPLLLAIAVLFPSGLLASPVPLTCNAVGVALVLFGWCGGPSGDCQSASATQLVAPKVHEPAP